MELDWEALRPGQLSAVQIIEQRVLRGGRTTAIVLPCRYGKSDVARILALKMWDAETASAALALSPNTTLRDQLADTRKWHDTFHRYQVRVKNEPRIGRLLKLKMPLNPNGEMFLSATTQLVSHNCDVFEQWIEFQVNRTGLPVVVFVDECHTGSDSNEWGKIVPRLANAGAHIVLLTATADRADSQRIPGFRFETVAEEPITTYRCSAGSRPDLVKVDVREGVNTKLRLLADLEVSFGEAWDLRALCKISRTPYDVDLRTVKGVDEEHRWLSELSSTDARKYLGKLVRDPLVITEGCRRLVTSLHARHQVQPDVQAIVYCGSDQDTDISNRHPKDIKKALLREDPSLNVTIATSADADDGALEQFIGGSGDVLVVKQMAGVGLDIPRCKVGLDLSPTRTYAALVQRMMRPATPYQGVMAMEWISPDDVTSAALFEKLVTERGGEASISDLTTVDSYEKERKDTPERPLLFVDGTSAADFDDSGGTKADRDMWSTVEKLVRSLPALTLTYSQAEIAHRITGLGLVVDESDKMVSVRDTSAEADAIREVINKLAKDCTNEHLRIHGLAFDSYGQVIKQLWVHAKECTDGWRPGLKSDATDDLELLGRLRDMWESLYAQLVYRG